MATVAQVEQSLSSVYGIPKIKDWEEDFLGSGWAFVVCVDGSAWWIKGNTCLASERNR